jgi:TetR/AcrR family transcriptional regulator, tetracycline repressor protein
VQRLSRDAIVASTLALMDEHGVDGVSMRAVAARLDCEAMSLYRHVSDKAHLLELVGQRIVQEIRVPDPDQGPWADALCELLRELRRVALEHPAAFQLISRGPISALGPAPLEAGMRALARSGLDDQSAASTLCVLLAYTTGAIANELAANALGGPLARASDGTDERWDDAPHARSFLATMEQTSYEAEFDAGLRLVVHGLDKPR